MARGAEDPVAVAEAFSSDAREIYGEGLISVVLYGSAAGPHYLPGKSDINLMMVLSEGVVDHLDRAVPLVKKWGKKRVAVPLILTPRYVETSLDVFPLEYLAMRRAYRVVHGKDPMAELRFEPRFVRLQCEREIKGKLLLLRETYLQSGGKARLLEKALAQSLPSLRAIFGGLLFLKGVQEPLDDEKLLRTVAEEFGLVAEPFLSLLDLKKGGGKAGANMGELYMEVVGQLRRLSVNIDEWGR